MGEKKPYWVLFLPFNQFVYRNKADKRNTSPPQSSSRIVGQWLQVFYETLFSVTAVLISPTKAIMFRAQFAPLSLAVRAQY